MSEHRVTMLGASWRRFEDPTRSRDPRVRAVVSALATLPAEAPRAEFRSELRAQLVAIAPRVVAESAEARGGAIDVAIRPAAARAKTATPPTSPQSAKHSDSFLDRLRGIRLGRPLAVAASLVTAFVMLLGGAVWMSRSALPGDNLYGLKRASERIELATAGSDSAKARDHLKFAATRAEEVQALVARRAGPGGNGQASTVNPETARLVASTLSSADSDVTAASYLLGKQAVRNGSSAPLNTMKKWAPGQLARLQAIAAGMPSSALRARTESSESLVEAALTRAVTLAPRVDCSCTRSARVDTLGPVPCETCPPATGGGQTPSGPGQGVGGTTKGTGAAGSHANSGTGGNAPNSSVVPPHSSAVPAHPGVTAANGSTGAQPGVPLPPIKLPTSSLPVNVSSCSVGASLGPLNIGIGLCTPPVKVSLHH